MIRPDFSTLREEKKENTFSSSPPESVQLRRTHSFYIKNDQEFFASTLKSIKEEEEHELQECLKANHKNAKIDRKPN